MAKNTYQISVLPGDGVGPEVTTATTTVLDAATQAHGFALDYVTYEYSSDYYRRTGVLMGATEMDALGKADAILFGAMGSPDVRKPDGTEAVSQLDLRRHFDLFASLRPAKLLPGVAGPLKATGIDMLVIRETSEGLFAGCFDMVEPDDNVMSDRMTITRKGCVRLFETAFAQARSRRAVHGTAGKVTLLDKSNALRSNTLMRKVFNEVAAQHLDVQAETLYVDSGTMYIVTKPSRFDVIVTENMFGDIASEVAAGVVGGIGMAPSAEIGDRQALFQPCHGSAPDIAGKGLANPIGTILSGALLLEWLAERHADARCAKAAVQVRAAVDAALQAGVHTADLGGNASTTDMAQAVADLVRSPLPV